MPEEKTSSRFDFLRGKAAMAVTGVLALEIILFYSIPTKEYIPTPPPLEAFANNVGPWQTVHQYAIDDYTRDLLKADDTLTRDYTGPSNVELFVAFFKSQRAGVTPHSPKMCLPANGWAEESSGLISIRIPGEHAAISVNRYVVTKDGQRNLVLYWFQDFHRVTANEYLSRLYLIYDSLRYRRSDEALVRVIRDVDGTDETAAQKQAVQFIQDLYEPLKRYIWSGPSNASLLP
jgi:EpsI family protein